MKTVVLIPAHNEEACLAETLRALARQTVPLDRTIVVADNCTDATPDIALAESAELFVTVHNKGKKAGGLNQALAVLLPEYDDTDIILVTDADSHLSPDFMEVACGHLADRLVGAVGGMFYGSPGAGLIGLLQRSEYVRYARQIARKGCDAYVLTGTGTAFTVGALREVAAARTDGRLPAGPGACYDEATMTEDSYMTFAIKTLGYRTPSPMECWVSTEVMPTWRQLWKQRLRWQLGALENLRAFGLFTRVTWKYTARQIVSLCEIVFFVAYATTSVWSGVTGTYRVVPFWLGIGALFWLERIISVRKAGLRPTLLAATLLIELSFGLFLKAVTIRGLIHAVRGREISWS